MNANVKYPALDKSALVECVPSDQGNNQEYWLSRPSEERIAAIELCRRIHYGSDRVTGRLRRVLETVEFPPR